VACTTVASTAGRAADPKAPSARARGIGAREDIRVVGSYADVRAVAVSRRYVYSATTSGIAIYDRTFQTWLPPLSRELGLESQINVLAGDPVEDALWVGVDGAVVMYRPQTEQVQRTMLTGVPDAIVFDRSGNGDVYVRTLGGMWTRVSRVGIATPMSAAPARNSIVLPANLGDVYTRFPGLRSGAPLLFRDQLADRALRPYQVVSGASAVDQPNDVWLGTNGDGLYQVDGATQQATALRFGLLERGVGAVALAADGVWAAGLGQTSLRAGLSFASTDLQRWRWIDGTITVPMLGARARSMSTRGNRAWIGTDRGVVRVRLDARAEMSAWTVLDGLPDNRVFAVQARGEGAWVGTARGLVYVTDSTDQRNTRTRGISTRLLENMPVFALQSVGDTLWIGSEGGLFALPPSGTLARPVGRDPALRRPVLALAWSDTVLLAATEEAILSLSPTGGVEPSRLDIDVRQVGIVTRIAIDDYSIVVAGTDGLIVLRRRAGGGLQFLRAPRDVPGPVFDVVLSRDWIWCATPEGLVRLRRSSDGGLP
jgi:ligand-binding sensor domain-containing protein